MESEALKACNLRHGISWSILVMVIAQWLNRHYEIQARLGISALHSPQLECYTTPTSRKRSDRTLEGISKAFER